MATKYLHTINSQPAFFSEPDEQICFITRYGPSRHALRDSLRQIRKDQAATKEFRESCGHDYDDKEYGYVRIAVA